VQYRETHLEKGASYDATISGQPFDNYMAQLEAAYLKEIVPTVADAKSRYLDFACGTGRITATVSRMVGPAVGVDVSESMLSAAREKCPGVQFVCTDITRGGDELGAFDVATSFRFFGNTEQDVRRAVLGALARRVRKGGHLIVNNHRNPRALGTLLQRVAGQPIDQDLTMPKFRRLLRDEGFEVIRVQPIGAWLVLARTRADAALLAGPRAAAMERRFRHASWAPVAPDCILVARRV